MNKITINDIQPNTHYWMHNLRYDGKSIWRVVYVIEDEMYIGGPKGLLILMNGDSRKFHISYFSEWEDIFLIELLEPNLKHIDEAQPKKLYTSNFDIKTLPPAINRDGSLRCKNDKFDYGLNEEEAEHEYHEWLWDIKQSSKVIKNGSV